MAKKTKKDSDEIQNLYINRLKGRMMVIKPKDPNINRQILLLYGHHASLERMNGIARNLAQYGTVTLPDLPGFGGMSTFYSINKRPTLDNYADYLASFIKLKYKRKRVTIVAMSFSFLIVTKTLQKYPELAKKVDILVSTVGFVHYQDFKLGKWNILGLKILANVFKFSLPAKLFRYTALQGPVISATYKLMARKHSKMKDAESDEELKKRIEAEIVLWHINDVQTRMYTMLTMFSVDLCDKQVNLPVYHVSVDNDRYFDNNIVEQHMRIVYKDFTNFKSIMPAHMPSIVATIEDAQPFVPKELRKILSN